MFFLEIYTLVFKQMKYKKGFTYQVFRSEMEALHWKIFLI